MSEDVKNEDEYFEIKKIELEKLEEVAKKEKAFLLRADIIMGIIGTLTTTLAATKGYNPVLTYAELFTFPTIMLVHANIKILSILKKQKQQLMEELDSMNQSPENISGGKKR